MTNYNDGDYDRDDDINGNNNATTRSGSDGPIFDPVTTSRFLGVRLSDN